MALPTYPCPNPTCAHTFPLDAIKGAASLTCPRCGTVFQFRNTPAPPRPMPPLPPPPARSVRGAPAPRPPAVAKPPAPPTPTRPAKPPPPPMPRAVPVATPFAAPPAPPKAAPVPPAVPMAVPVGAATPAPSAPGFNFSPDEDLVAARRHRRGKHAIRNLILYGSISLIFLGGAAYGAWWLYQTLKNQPDAKDADDERTGNFAFTAPEAPWEEDRKTDVIWPMRRLYRRGDEGHVNNMAIYLRDYKDRTPSDGELISAGLAKLRAYFPNLEYDLKPRDDNDRLAGRPALRLAFQGESGGPEHVFSSGECYMMSYRGFAYWFITWGPELNKETIQDEWPKLRERFRLGNYREGWKDVPRKTRLFRPPNGSYQIEYYEYDPATKRGVWVSRKPEDYDPRAELALMGNDPRLGEAQRHESKRAVALVLMLDKADSLDEAVKKAEADLLERQKHKEGEGYLYPDTIIQDAPDESISKVRKVENKVGAFDGRILRKEVKNTDVRIRHVVLGVTVRPEGVLVISCECNNDPEMREKDPEFRDFWDQEFTALMAKVGPKKGG